MREVAVSQGSNVLIVGAGPTGLTHALWLVRQGVGVRIIDQRAGPGETSRAMVVQARTLELYQQLGLSARVVAAGHPNPTMNLWANGKRRARLAMGEAGADVTPYPFLLVYPQDQHERLLIEALLALGVAVERETRFVSFEAHADYALSRLIRADGTEEIHQSTYLSGCDGARSPIRHQVGADFEGGTYKQLFYVADVKLRGLEPAQEAHIALDRADFVAVLSYGREGLSRLIGVVTDGDPEHLTFDDVGHRAIERLGVTVDTVNWFSTYRVHHRVTDAFRHGRVFLLGDAAHVHSPVGGQGMNTGISDAINLAWKLAAVLKGEAPDALLDSYDQERRAFAQTLVETTDRLFTFITAESRFADFVRTRIAPGVAGLAYRVDGVREMLFRIVSQTALNYHGSALSAGRAGKVEGGDRLPWVQIGAQDNFTPLAHLVWQVHVYGAASSELMDWGARRGVPVHVFAWNAHCEAAGLARDAVYLLRPDTYVALAAPQGAVAALEQYFQDRGIVTRA
jgi:2-polyprenyl-6-methoxyphenol hydroxylase-like FAD-dependent oxidoreductase